MEYYVGSPIHPRFLVFVSNADLRLKCSSIPQEEPDNDTEIPQPKVSVFCLLIESLGVLPCLGFQFDYLESGEMF